MPFEISTTHAFAAAHQLRLADGALESLHGHNWRVRVTVASDQLDASGLVMDFHELERRVEAVLAPLCNRHLNELRTFESTNPSAENLALHVFRSLQVPAPVKLRQVEVWETEQNCAVYRA